MNAGIQWRSRLALMCLGLLLACHWAGAQTVYGTLVGTVADSTGAVVPGAQVVATETQSGFKLQATTSSAGTFRFPEAAIGTYNLAVTATGFQAQQLTGVKVNLQVTTAVNVTLQVGSATQTVTVDASSQQLQTASSDITGSITEQQYNDLPLALGGVGALRSPEAFIFLLPGNTGPGTANSNNGVFESKIAGGQDYGAEVLIDGLSQQRSENGSSFDEEAPSVENLKELTVTDAVPPAEYNRTTGGFENFTTKSGGNSYHGTAFELFRNTDLDANSWLNGGLESYNCAGANDTPACRSTYATPVDRKNDFGGNLGGPIWIPKLYNGKDRLFFFYGWEQIRYSVGAITTATVPTAAELGGDFSAPALFNTSNIVGTNPCDGTPVYQGQIFDPSTTRTVNGVECRTAFPGNKIPGGFSPAALKLLSYFPQATNSNVFNNYVLSSTSPIQNTTYTLRIDANLTAKSKLWSSYSTRDNNRVSGTPQILPYPIDPNTWKQDFDTHFWRLGWDYSLTPNLLNHLIVGTNRSNSINYAFPLFNKINYTEQAGIGNADSFNFPQITNGVTTNEGNPAQNDDNIDNGIRLVDSVTWQKGAHSLTFGVDMRYQQYSPIDGNSPVINFCTGQTSAYTGSANNGNGLASELLGNACGGSQNLYSHQSRWISWYYSGYVQDDWKVNRNLTLNLGVNYSVDVPRHEALNYTSNFSATATDPEYGVPGALVFGTQCNGCNAKWADTYYKDIAPRLGFAYTPPWLNTKTVLRGGFGILYGPLQYDDFGGSMNAGYKSSPTFPSKNGFDPSFQIDSGYPAFASPPDLDPGLYNGSYLPGSYIEKKAGRPAAIYNWDMQVQQQLAQDLVLTIGYVGSAGQNLQANNQNINNIPYNKEFSTGGNTLNAQLMNNPYGVAVPFTGYFNLWGDGVTVQQALRPFPQYDYIDSGCCLQATGHSSYEALLVSLARQFHNGLSLQASYTFSKNENDTDSALPNTNPGQPQVQNPANLKEEKAISIQDLPNSFVVSYLYELPFGKGKKWLNHGIASYTLGGWKIGGVQRYQNGQPLAFCCTVGIPGWEQSIRYDEISGASVKSAAYKRGWRHVNPFSYLNGGVGSDPNSNSFFNGSDTSASTYQKANPAFHDQNAAVNVTNAIAGNNVPYELGNTPRVTGIRMPKWLSEDFSLLKDIPIHESLDFELKAEFLDAFNRHYFSPPDTNPADFGFGVPTAIENGPRNIQITGRLRF
ncbi:TonB-dependent receptor [Silvibacterium sp.]|uniref:TonB-dependent receptor n=1 Tax=Silvibacterium sp. TaxID=1964179 RepID=UPI0039E4E42B